MGRFSRAWNIALCMNLAACAFRATAQQVPHALPQALPGTSYAAQLAIPPGLGYPFAHCELSGEAPRWLTVDCVRLQLKGKVPAAPVEADASYQVTLTISDNSGNSRRFPLALRVSANPQVVVLDDVSKPDDLGQTVDNPPSQGSDTRGKQIPKTSTQASEAHTEYTNTPRSPADVQNAGASNPPEVNREPNDAARLNSAAMAFKSTVVLVGTTRSDSATRNNLKSTRPAAGIAEAAAAKAASLPIAMKGVFYSVHLKVDAPTGIIISGDATYSLKEEPSWPSGLVLNLDAKGNPVLEGIPDHAVQPALTFTVVVSDEGIPKLAALYSLAVNASQIDEADPASNSAAGTPKVIENPLIVGQGYAETLDVASPGGCQTYSVATQAGDLNDWGLDFDTKNSALSSTRISNSKDLTLPPALILSVTCKLPTGSALKPVWFSIPLQAERKTVTATGFTLPPACPANTPGACAALAATRERATKFAWSKKGRKNTKEQGFDELMNDYQALIDAAKADSANLQYSATTAAGTATVTDKTNMQNLAQQWSDLACDLEANLPAFKVHNYQIPPGNPPPLTSLNGCYQSSPYFRGLLGGMYTGASSTDPQFKLVADVSVDMPLESDKKTKGIANSQLWWLWGYARIGSISSQPTGIDPAQIASQYASLSSAQPSKVVQSFEMNVGVARQLHAWRGNLTYFDHGSFSVIAGGGALTPVSPSQAEQQTYEIRANSFDYLAGIYPGLGKSNCAPSTDNSADCYVSFYPQDRSRFYSYYEGGMRLKLYPSPQYQKATPFPAIFDVTLGQNSYVTGGSYNGVVVHVGGSTPLPFIPGLYVFGAMDIGFLNRADKTVNAVFIPTALPLTADGVTPLDFSQPPPNRDRYSLGFGVDILQLIRTHQIQDAFKK